MATWNVLLIIYLVSGLIIIMLIIQIYFTWIAEEPGAKKYLDIMPLG